MMQPWWKRILSYLTELHIESAPSELNPHLYVSLAKGRYQLATKNAIYSFADLYNNYMLSFESLNWDKIDGNEMLLLGVGLGSIPYMLERKLDRKMRYTGVEIDENVLYLANKYVLRDLKSPCQMHCTDAWNFIIQSKENFDIICMDVFVDDEIPDRLFSMDFLELLRDRLTPTGVLMYNCLARTDADLHASKKFLFDEFLMVFPEGGYLDVRGNWMLVNRKEYFTS
jgi:spermidine synthase